MWEAWPSTPPGSKDELLVLPAGVVSKEAYWPVNTIHHHHQALKVLFPSRHGVSGSYMGNSETLIILLSQGSISVGWAGSKK